MKAQTDDCFELYCNLTPFAEHSFGSWQQFAAQHLCQPLTFDKHNYKVLLQQHDVTVREMLEQKRRADKLQVRQHHKILRSL
jgi:hypothetical protein